MVLENDPGSRSAGETTYRVQRGFGAGNGLQFCKIEFLPNIYLQCNIDVFEEHLTELQLYLVRKDDYEHFYTFGTKLKIYMHLFDRVQDCNKEVVALLIVAIT
jgi:hypothetical protein